MSAPLSYWKPIPASRPIDSAGTPIEAQVHLRLQRPAHREHRGVLAAAAPTLGLNQTSATSGLAEMARWRQFPSNSVTPRIGPTPK